MGTATAGVIMVAEVTIMAGVGAIIMDGGIIITIGGDGGTRFAEASPQTALAPSC